MKKLNLLGLVLLGASVPAFTGCSEDISLADQMNENYVKSFVEKYGLPGEGNMFNMAKHGQVTVKSSKPVNVEVIAMENGKYYSFAYCQGVCGTQTIHFDIPSYMQDVVLYVNEQYYPTKIGATYDLDHPVRSREGEATVWTDAMLADKEVTILDYTPGGDNDGRVAADLSPVADIHPNGETSAGGTSHDHIGRHLKEFISENSADYDKFENKQDGPSHNGNLHYITFLNITKPEADHDYEIGVYYGDGQNMLSSEKIYFIPLFRTDEVKGASVAVDYNGRREGFTFDQAGVEFVIDFAGEGHTEFIETTDGFKNARNEARYLLGNLVRDNKATYGDQSLEARLERHAAAQTKLPSFATLRENGATDYTPNLPKFDEVTDPWEFYENYDAYIWSWLNAHTDVKADIYEYDQFERLLGTTWIEIPEYAIPYVRKEGDQKYRVTYYTAYRAQQLETPQPYTGKTGESFCNIDDDHLYSHLGVTVAVPGNNSDAQHDYVVYMKDLNTGTVVSTANGSRVKGTSDYIMSPNVKCENGFPITMLDFDGNGVYNNLVYQRAWPGGPQDGPTFEDYTWYLACEDLGSTDDCDFNDAVFAIQYLYGNSLTIQNINVRPLAAGGIYPIYLMWSDGNTNYMVGKEVHSWLGDSEVNEKGELPFINTLNGEYEDLRAPTATFEYDILQHNMSVFSFDSYVNDLWQGGTMAGFWLLVDKDNAIADLANNNIDFSICDTEAMMAKYPSLWKVNNHPVGGNSIVPQMMLVTQAWEWPMERDNISEVYSDWQTWMNSSNPTSVKWYGYQLEGVDRSRVVKRWEE